jgi:hypothetical protein
MKKLITAFASCALLFAASASQAAYQRFDFDGTVETDGTSPETFIPYPDGGYYYVTFRSSDAAYVDVELDLRFTFAYYNDDGSLNTIDDSEGIGSAFSAYGSTFRDEFYIQPLSEFPTDIYYPDGHLAAVYGYEGYGIIELSYEDLYNEDDPTGSFSLTLSSVPEAGSWTIMLVGLAISGLALRFQRRRLSAKPFDKSAIATAITNPGLPPC